MIRDTFETVGPLEVKTEAGNTQQQEAIEFETLAEDNNTATEQKLPLGLITTGVIIICFIILFIAIRMKISKKNTAATKRKLKVSSANRKFEERREEENNNLDKYATNFLNQYDYSDNGQQGNFILRDLYQDEQSIRDKEKENELEKKKDIYGFFDDDSQTIEHNKKKAEKVDKLKNEIDGGLTDDIDDYFNKQEAYSTNNEEWTYEDNDLKSAVSEITTDDNINNFDEKFFKDDKKADATEIESPDIKGNDSDHVSISDISEKATLNPVVNETKTDKISNIPSWMNDPDDDDFI